VNWSLCSSPFAVSSLHLNWIFELTETSLYSGVYFSTLFDLFPLFSLLYFLVFCALFLVWLAAFFPARDTQGEKTLLVLMERLSHNEIEHPMPDSTAASAVRALDGLKRHFGAILFKKLFQSIIISTHHRG
jgi:hypothetical protein